MTSQYLLEVFGSLDVWPEAGWMNCSPKKTKENELLARFAASQRTVESIYDLMRQ
jgi:hypothetical protein